MARMDSPRRRGRGHQTEVQHEEFYETMAAVGPRTYHSEVIVEEESGPERAVRLVAGILNTLLALRFVIALFTNDTRNAITAIVFNATGWLVAPMQALFGAPHSGGGGYFDLSALAAIVLVAAVAWAINLIIRQNRTHTL